MKIPISISDLSEKKWLTKKEVAIYTGFSKRFIDSHIRPFVLCSQLNPQYKGKVLFSREELDKFIISRRVGITMVSSL